MTETAMPSDFKKLQQKLAREQIAYDKKRGLELAEMRMRAGFKAGYVAYLMKIHASHFSDLERGRRHWNPDLEAAYLAAIGQTSNQTKKGNQNANGRSARG